MSKKPEAKKTTAKKSTKAAGEAKAAKQRVRSLDMFRFVKENVKAKLAPQAKVILNALKAAKKAISRDDLIKLLEGVLETKQTPSRIVTYYQKALEESGAISVVRAAKPEAKKPAAKKPAATSKK